MTRAQPVTLKSITSEVGKAAKLFMYELKPRGPVFTPFNVITGVIIVVGIILVIIRMFAGLGSVTNLSQEFPWGIWIGFDVVTGVAFAAGAYVITFVVYILGNEKYKPLVRATVLNGLLAYMFYAGALLLDLGRPWKAPNPLIGNYFGVSSVLFLIAWHFFLYMICEFVEFLPVVAEWLGWNRVRKFLHGLTLGAVILGITLSTLHQSGLGALFLMAKSKIHPLWYSTNIPVLFFVSSIFAGLSMIIIESTFTHKIFSHRLGRGGGSSHNELVLGLGKGAAFVMFAYFFLKILDIVHNRSLCFLGTPMGSWYLLEMIGFVLVPIILFTLGVRDNKVRMVQVAAFFAVFGILLNRLNLSVIAFKWYAADHYFPSWQEIWITLMIISIELWAFRWAVNRMPVLSDKIERRSIAEVGG